MDDEEVQILRTKLILSIYPEDACVQMELLDIISSYSVMQTDQLM